MCMHQSHIAVVVLATAQVEPVIIEVFLDELDIEVPSKVPESPLRDIFASIFDGYKETVHLFSEEDVMTIVTDLYNDVLILGICLCFQCGDVGLLGEQLFDLFLDHLVSC